jgi:protein-L-isoaspartate(D-aspartate) O-methyltransferase
MEAENIYERRRFDMVARQIAGRGLREARLINALQTVPRHAFVPEAYRDEAYEDRPLPIGNGQTISQPYIVALMTYLLHLNGTESVLEIGTGSGYQAAVLSLLVSQVYTVEYDAYLAEQAVKTLQQLGYLNVTIRTGDGSGGWPEHAPYEGILVTAASPQVPEPLLQQLSQNGQLVIPVGGRMGQRLQVWWPAESGYDYDEVAPVAFVPLRGAWGWNETEWAWHRN